MKKTGKAIGTVPSRPRVMSKGTGRGVGRDAPGDTKSTLKGVGQMKGKGRPS